ncbi:pre-rRNA processing [Entomophthora muscae]|uniref:Pre-rRNA processing n=1 Tax=Entomophthora muscae TaxID=34485 RepID=A0ACC2SSB7_9FUNG|nr:pre-rRNA processing [Entomophthora muscae]
MATIPIKSLDDLDMILSSCPKLSGPYEKSFYLSLIREFNSILMFISFQEDFAISDPAAQEQVCEFLIDSPFFTANLDLFQAHLRQCACTVQPDNDLYGCLWLIYRMLVSLNHRSKDSLGFSMDQRSYLVPKLLKELKEPLDGLLELPALLLLTEIFKNTSLTSLELRFLNDEDLLFLFALSEHSRLHNESFSYAVNLFLLYIHHQTLDTCPDSSDPFSGQDDFCRFRKKLISKTEDPFCDSAATHDFAGLVRCSPVLRFLQNNFHSAKTFGEDLVFMLNRESKKCIFRISVLGNQLNITLVLYKYFN